MKPEYRTGIPSTETSFHVKQIDLPEFDVAWHYHPHFELTYILQSTGIRYVGDSMHPFDRGDLVLMGSNLPHCWKTVESKEDVHCVVVHWQDASINDWVKKPEFSDIKSLLDHAGRGISFDLNTSLELEPYFKKLTTVRPFERLITLLQILDKLANAPNRRILAGPGFHNTLSDKASDRVSLINNYLKDHILENVTLTEVASLVSMSREAFSRFFKKTFGKPFTTYVNEYKINLASKMLIQTDLSVSEIGYRTGFNNLTFFHRQFHRFQNMPPSKYRKEYRGI
ncbi:MAG: AraC family transcriptional regulator [Bacteroidota bacterium]